MVSTIEINFELKFVQKQSIWGDFRSKFGSKMVKSSYFQCFHFCSSVLQIHKRNKYDFYLSDQSKNNFICETVIYGDFGSKFGPDLGQKLGKNDCFLDFHFSSLVLMLQNCY